MTYEEPSEVAAPSERKSQAKYRVVFLRGRRESSHIEIVDYVEAKDPEEAVDHALTIASRYKWHVEKVERLLNERLCSHGMNL